MQADLVFAESFSRYKVANFGDADLTANFLMRYTQSTLSSFCSIDSNGRNGACISLNRGGGGFSKTLAHSARWVIGFAYRINGASASISDVVYTILNNATVLFSLRQDNDGTLSLYAGNSNAIAVSDRPLLATRWYYIEVDVTFSGSTISVSAELRINGHVEASGSGSSGVVATSLPSQNAKGNVHQFTPPSGVGGGNSFDDLYIKPTAGYYGDITIIALFANGDGTTLQWTPSSGIVSYDRVNTHPVDLTKWLEDSTPGHITTLQWEDCPGFSGTIKAVNLSWLAQKDDEGTKSFKGTAGPTGTDATSEEFFVSDVTPEYYEWSLEDDPAAGPGWTQAGFNGTEWGVDLVS